MSFSNSGTVDIQTGTLSLQGGGTIGAGAAFTGAGFTRLGGFYSPSATMTINGAATATNLALDYGTLTGPGDLTVSNEFDWTGGTLSGTGKLFLDTGAQMNLTGATTTMTGGNRAVDTTTTTAAGAAVNWTGGTLADTFADQGTFNLDGAADKTLGLPDGPGGTVNLSGPGTSVWNGTGRLLMTNGAAFNNLAGSTINVQSPLSILSEGLGMPVFTNAGTFRQTVTTGTTTFGTNPGFSGSPPVAFNNSGTVDIQTGTVDLAGALTNFSGSTLTGGTYLVTGTFQFCGANIATNAANIVLNGTASRIIDSSGNDALKNFATNAAAGSFTIQNGRNFTSAGAFSNAGNVIVGSGSTFNSTGDYNHSGGNTILAGGTLDPINVNLSGGSLSGSGTVVANVNNTGGQVNPGGAGAAGVITVTGNYTQGASGVLNIDLGGLTAGSQFDQLNVSGTATLGGTIDASLFNNFTPAAGEAFRDVMDFASVSGDFTTQSGFSLGNSLSLQEQFDPSSNPVRLNLVVDQAPIIITNPTNPAVSDGQTATFTAAASGIPTPTVQWQVSTDSGQTFSNIPNATSITLSFPATSAQNGYQYRAVFTNTAGTATTTAATLKVLVATSTTLALSPNSPNPSVFGQSVTFTAIVSAAAPASGTPTGSVTFLDVYGNITLTLGTATLNTSGKATLTTKALPAGQNTITAVYSGDSNFATSTSKALTPTVNQAATTTTVSSSVNPSVSGQPITFTAKVKAVAPGSGVPTGTVTFYDTFDGSTMTLGTAQLPDGSGQATISISTLSVGSHTITAVYGGDSNFITSTSKALTPTVNQAATTTTVVSSANPSVSGQAVTFTATVAAVAPGSGIPTGTVTFYDGITPLGTAQLYGSGQATISISTLSVGTHTITAVYDGDSNFATSTSSVFNQKVK